MLQYNNNNNTPYPIASGGGTFPSRSQNNRQLANAIVNLEYNLLAGNARRPIRSVAEFLFAKTIFVLLDVFTVSLNKAVRTLFTLGKICVQNVPTRKKETYIYK